MKGDQELLKSILKPLIEVIKAGRIGDSLKLQISAGNIASILGNLGYLKESTEVLNATM